MSRRGVLLEALAATPRDLERMTRRIDAADAVRRPVPGQWCVVDVVAHLADVEERYLARLQRVVALDTPREAAITPHPDAHDLQRPLAEHVAAFAERRAATIAFLSSLEQRDWGRRLVHETEGPSRLRDQVQALVGHDNEHLAQITNLREALEYLDPEHASLSTGVTTP
jgi:uncharacterized damage-inducible protein DinB